MTRTAAGLRALAAPHARARVLATALGWAGAALGCAALGIAGAPRPVAVVLAWLGVIVGFGGAVWLARRGQQRLGAPRVARMVEHAARARDGSVVGPAAAPGRNASAELWDAADTRAAEVVTRATPEVNGVLGRGTRGRLAFGGGVALVGAIAFVASAPGSGRAAAFWHPLRTLRDARAPVRVSVDRAAVRRGETVTALVEVPATRATLCRGAGDVATAAAGTDPPGRQVTPGPERRSSARQRTTAQPGAGDC
jgi:hypothetical protein